MSPYPGSGSFTSRVLDAGQSADWGALSWTADTPAGTSVALSVRTGNTPTPDGSWSAFTPISANGGDIPGNSRYLQYRADLSSSDQGKTPALSQVSASYTQAATPPDPPQITATDPASPANDNNPKVKGTLGAGNPQTVKSSPTPRVRALPLRVAPPPSSPMPGSRSQFRTITRRRSAPPPSTPPATSRRALTPFDYTEDSTAPETQIDSGPSGTTNDASPSFTFSSPDNSASFQCRLDSNNAADWASCSSPKAYSSLADGTHTFEVRAVDTAGNPDPTPASRTFTVDTNAPETQIDSGPSGTTNDASPSFTFSSPDNSASFQCRLDSNNAADWASCSSPKAYSSLADGTHTFEVRAVDAAGNPDPTPASRTFTVDTNAPETQIDSGPSGTTNDASPSFTFSSPDNSASFQCRLDSNNAADWASCSSPKAYSSLADGTHTFEVRAVDTAGNPDPTPASRTFTVDTNAPETQIDSGPSGTTNDASPSFTFSSPDNSASFQCRLDSNSAADWASCSSPKAYSSLADGTHTFEVRAIDTAGNPDPTPASAHLHRRHQRPRDPDRLRPLGDHQRRQPELHLLLARQLGELPVPPRLQ